ncbi:MAG: agmatine/peptidylarginine deiminase [Ilumatobacteraceae bacterium]
MSTPALAGFSMPPEWVPHRRTWMEFPCANEGFGSDPDGDLGHYRQVWASVANTIVEFEPVSLVCDLGDGEIARRLVDPRIEIHETPIDDAWARDSGPTFLLHPDGRLGATHWRFNAWGDAGYSRYDDEQFVGAFIAGLAGAELFTSEMVNEGGGIHVDGEGTVLATRTVQLDPDRNPGWTAERVDTEFRAHLGTSTTVWLPRGLTRDYDRFGTRGHVDIVATFARPGVVLAHAQPDPDHPDHEVCRENLALLRAATDAAGRRLEVIEVPAPTVTHVDGLPVDWSYINHYVCNGGVVLCSFDDPRDAEAAEIVARAYPGRKVVLHDARDVFACGGGIHCITQQEPLAGA